MADPGGVEETINGAGFDHRFLQAAFPRLGLPPIHIDLRPTTRKLGLTGGLKAIEASLGLERDRAIRDLSGFDAVRMWRRYQRGDRGALDLLVEYNRADVIHLKTILEICYARLAAETRRLLDAPPHGRRCPVPRLRAVVRALLGEPPQSEPGHHTVKRWLCGIDTWSQATTRS